MSDVRVVNIADIKESPVALRNVDTQSEAFLGLVHSIEEKGLINAISVRAEEVEGVEVLILVDGLHRFTASKEAGLTEIPVNVLAIDKGGVLEAQIIANVHKIETKPVQYSKQIFKILAGNPLLTITELATKLAKSPAWLRERLGLLKLIGRAQTLVDEDKIGLSNAYSLAKLPSEEQADWVDRAMTQAPQEFLPAVNARVKDIKKSRREGKDPADQTFVAVARMRKVKEIKDELDGNNIGPILVSETGADTAEAGFALGVSWTMHMDPKSIEVAKVKDDERKAARAAAADERKAERLAKKAKEAAAEAEKAQAEVAGTAE